MARKREVTTFLAAFNACFEYSWFDAGESIKAKKSPGLVSLCASDAFEYGSLPKQQSTEGWQWVRMKMVTARRLIFLVF